MRYEEGRSGNNRMEMMVGAPQRIKNIHLGEKTKQQVKKRAEKLLIGRKDKVDEKY